MVHFDSPFLLAMLPPGAFIGLGLLLAVKYLIDERMKARTARALRAEPAQGQGQAEKA
ncbi:Electron transport complex protein RnfE [compost metagenome]